MMAPWSIPRKKPGASTNWASQRTAAPAIQPISKAIANNPGFVQLRRIETAKQVAHAISESANGVYLPADSLLLNLREEGEKK